MTIHDTLPSGFAYANESQAEEFTKTGSVHGASKVALVRAGYEIDGSPRTDLAVRLRPPRTFLDIRSGLGRRAAIARRLCATKTVKWYIAEYNNGWQAAKQSFSAAWDSGQTSAAWDDGYLDQAAGRPKWHLTYCIDHDNCGEG